VVFQLQALLSHIQALPPGEGAGVRSPQQRLALAALSELQLTDVEALVEPGPQGRRAALDATLERLAQQVAALSDSLSSSYLNHAAVSRHLRGGSRGDVRGDVRGAEPRGDTRPLAGDDDT
jgi:uncharacterized alpha-E superfamily protein